MGGEGKDGPAGDASRDRDLVVGVTGAQDREDDLARLDLVRTGRGECGDLHGVDSVCDHPIHIALRHHRQLARERPDPAHLIKLLHPSQTFFYRYVGVRIELTRRREITLSP